MGKWARKWIKLHVILLTNSFASSVVKFKFISLHTTAHEALLNVCTSLRTHSRRFTLVQIFTCYSVI